MSYIPVINEPNAMGPGTVSLAGSRGSAPVGSRGEARGGAIDGVGASSAGLRDSGRRTETSRIGRPSRPATKSCGIPWSSDAGRCRGGRLTARANMPAPDFGPCLIPQGLRPWTPPGTPSLDPLPAFRASLRRLTTLGTSSCAIPRRCQGAALSSGMQVMVPVSSTTMRASTEKTSRRTLTVRTSAGVPATTIFPARTAMRWWA